MRPADPAPDDGRSEKELVDRARAGSLEAFEELVFRFEGHIYAFLLNCCKNDADARDVTQETFLRAFRALDRFNPRRPFGPWLFTIARRKWLDRARVRKPAYLDDLSAEIADTDDPAELLSREEQRRDLWARARSVLPDNQFQALWLRYVEGMDVAQIASVLSKTQTHVKVLLFRARRSLASELRSADQTQWTFAPSTSRAALSSTGGEGRGEEAISQARFRVQEKQKTALPRSNSSPALGLTPI